MFEVEHRILQVLPLGSNTGNEMYRTSKPEILTDETISSNLMRGNQFIGWMSATHWPRKITSQPISKLPFFARINKWMMCTYFKVVRVSIYLSQHSKALKSIEKHSHIVFKFEQPNNPTPPPPLQQMTMKQAKWKEEKTIYRDDNISYWMCNDTIQMSHLNERRIAKEIVNCFWSLSFMHYPCSPVA